MVHFHILWDQVSRVAHAYEPLLSISLFYFLDIQAILQSYLDPLDELEKMCKGVSSFTVWLDV